MGFSGCGSSGMVFHPLLENWLMLVSLLYLYVLMNENPLKEIILARWLRQGDPLSPYLFILGNEVLSKLLLKAQGEGILSGYEVAGGFLKISHLLYVDVTMLFREANIDPVNLLQQCLHKYSYWSGQHINMNKSSIIFSKNVSQGVNNRLQTYLGFKLMDKTNRFLGNPLCISKNRYASFKFTLDKVMSKLKGWHCKLLSQAGGTTLRSSFIQGIPSYCMSTYLVPNSICDDLDKIARKFWWLGNF
ncbi:uncharacterized protein LOC133832764 [Humulus lupulus]|uniref:uncharacterized protein LOC133832764 n=1 Tax=Humulus lupulus TaxID=3486 RepID=UPI002B4134CC|nr:uncharacterized protein LOC133832764 [Humulus lupulus]